MLKTPENARRLLAYMEKNVLFYAANNNGSVAASAAPGRGPSLDAVLVQLRAERHFDVSVRALGLLSTDSRLEALV